MKAQQPQQPMKGNFFQKPAENSRGAAAANRGTKPTNSSSSSNSNPVVFANPKNNRGSASQPQKQSDGVPLVLSSSSLLQESQPPRQNDGADSREVQEDIEEEYAVDSSAVFEDPNYKSSTYTNSNDYQLQPIAESKFVQSQNNFHNNKNNSNGYQEDYNNNDIIEDDYDDGYSALQYSQSVPASSFANTLAASRNNSQPYKNTSAQHQQPKHQQQHGQPQKVYQENEEDEYAYERRPMQQSQSQPSIKSYQQQQQQLHQPVLFEKHILDAIAADIREDRVAQALDMCEQTLRESRMLKNEIEFEKDFDILLKFLNNQAMTYLNIQQKQKCFLILIKCKQLTESDYTLTPSAKRALTLNNFGCYYRRLKMLPKALKHLEMAERFLVSAKKTQYLGMTYLNISAVLSQIGEHYSSLEHAKKAVKEIHNEYQEALKHRKFEDAYQDADFIEICQALAIAFYNVGVEQEHFQEYEMSLANYRKACEVADDNLGTNHQLTKKFSDLLRQFTSKLADRNSPNDAPRQATNPQKPALLSRPQSGNPRSSKSSLNLSKMSDKETISQKVGPFRQSYGIKPADMTKIGRKIYFKGNPYSLPEKQAKGFPQVQPSQQTRQLIGMLRPNSALALGQQSQSSAYLPSRQYQGPMNYGDLAQRPYSAKSEQPLSSQGQQKGFSNSSATVPVQATRPRPVPMKRNIKDTNQLQGSSNNAENIDLDWDDNSPENSVDGGAQNDKLKQNQADFLKAIEAAAAAAVAQLKEEEEQIKERLRALKEEVSATEIEAQRVKAEKRREQDAEYEKVQQARKFELEEIERQKQNEEIELNRLKKVREEAQQEQKQREEALATLKQEQELQKAQLAAFIEHQKLERQRIIDEQKREQEALDALKLKEQQEAHALLQLKQQSEELAARKLREEQEQLEVQRARKQQFDEEDQARKRREEKEEKDREDHRRRQEEEVAQKQREAEEEKKQKAAELRLKEEQDARRRQQEQEEEDARKRQQDEEETVAVVKLKEHPKEVDKEASIKDLKKKSSSSMSSPSSSSRNSTPKLKKKKEEAQQMQQELLEELVRQLIKEATESAITKVIEDKKRQEQNRIEEEQKQQQQAQLLREEQELAEKTLLIQQAYRSKNAKQQTKQKALNARTPLLSRVIPFERYSVYLTTYQQNEPTTAYFVSVESLNPKSDKLVRLYDSQMCSKDEVDKINADENPFVSGQIQIIRATGKITLNASPKNAIVPVVEGNYKEKEDKGDASVASPRQQVLSDSSSTKKMATNQYQKEPDEEKFDDVYSDDDFEDVPQKDEPISSEFDAEQKAAALKIEKAMLLKKEAKKNKQHQKKKNEPTQQVLVSVFVDALEQKMLFSLIRKKQSNNRTVDLVTFENLKKKPHKWYAKTQVPAHLSAEIIAKQSHVGFSPLNYFILLQEEMRIVHTELSRATSASFIQRFYGSYYKELFFKVDQVVAENSNKHKMVFSLQKLVKHTRPIEKDTSASKTKNAYRLRVESMKDAKLNAVVPLHVYLAKHIVNQHSKKQLRFTDIVEVESTVGELKVKVKEVMERKIVESVLRSLIRVRMNMHYLRKYVISIDFGKKVGGREGNGFISFIRKANKFFVHYDEVSKQKGATKVPSKTAVLKGYEYRCVLELTKLHHRQGTFNYLDFFEVTDTRTMRLHEDFRREIQEDLARQFLARKLFFSRILQLARSEVELMSSSIMRTPKSITGVFILRHIVLGYTEVRFERIHSWNNQKHVFGRLHISEHEARQIADVANQPVNKQDRNKKFLETYVIPTF